ncbi:GNAT family N-acetyltransferase [Ornithinibacillus gellani]|uniref:GNAT family N-acetyltransferase n=1 Tax=Ornithinibacillus gellani TaxID=2293253 RepID=UPI001CC1D6C4|nr:GNAT family N-acetyltransferase [Ornithinibacillus gellani]
MMDRFAETEILLQDHCLRVRKLLESDGEILVKWLTDPAVLEFYEGRDQLFDLERVNRKFFARGDGVDRCIVEWKNHPIGYVQCYSVEKNKRLHPAFSDQDIIFGLDQFIGETAYWNQGIGSMLVGKMAVYLEEIRKADWVILDPQVTNERAIRCYEKCGFTKIKLFPAHEMHEGKYRDCWLMARNASS